MMGKSFIRRCCFVAVLNVLVLVSGASATIIITVAPNNVQGNTAVQAIPISLSASSDNPRR